MNNSQVNLISPVPPLMTIENFAETVGVTPSVVDGWIKRDYIPTKKMGKRRLVNMVQLTISLISDQDNPDSEIPLEILKTISNQKPNGKKIETISRDDYNLANRNQRRTLDKNIKNGKLIIK
jgi:hypothetical protein